jgi:hypothetical protein
MTTPGANFTAARTDSGQTFTGAQSITGNVTVGSDAVFFDATNQRIGINTASPSREIHITKTAAPSIYMRNNTKTSGVDIEYNTVDFRFQVRDSSPTVFINNNAETARIAVGGDFTIVGSTATKASGTTWANPSDIRLKDNIQQFTNGLSKLLQVEPKTWEYNGKGGTTAGTKGIGVIADEIESVLPETVDTYKAKLNPDVEDEVEIDIKRFDATEITWILVNSVKELSEKINLLENKLLELANK